MTNVRMMAVGLTLQTLAHVPLQAVDSRYLHFSMTTVLFQFSTLPLHHQQQHQQEKLRPYNSCQ